ncbi:hypothetical protein GGQ81_002231 [Sphingomonas desiccabilis]|nr:hypothetical protein [Sphingomonas desiccabilis]
MTAETPRCLCAKLALDPWGAAAYGFDQFTGSTP